MTWHYDPASNIYQIDRFDGTQETKSHDGMNRLISDTVPKATGVSILTQFQYYPYNGDAGAHSGSLLWTVTDGENHTYQFAYDASARKTSMTYPNNSSQQWAYDNAANLASRSTVNVNSETQSFAYDNRNRKTAMSWSNNADSASFTYDDAGRLFTATNPNSTVTRTYDAGGRLTVDQQAPSGLSGGARSVNYFYDDDGKVNRMYASGGNYDYTFSYDGMGRFEKIFVTNSSQLFQYYYDAASNEIQRSNFSDNVAQIYTPDELNRIKIRDLQRSGQSFSTETYTYDSMSRLRSVSREDGKQDAFGYYLDGELSMAQYGLVNNQNPTRSVTYNLDKAGNRTSVTDNVNGSPTYTPNTINQYTAVTGSTITNGNEHEVSIYKGPGDPQQVKYTYINDERLSSAVSPPPPTNPTNTYNLYYDALGRCVKRSLSITGQPTATTYYIYDGEKPVVEYDSTGAVVARNLYGKGIDEILMRADVANNWTIYYQQDHEGSVTHVTNASGGVVETFKYDAFGAPDHAPGHNNRFLFTGREYNSTFGFYEYRARAYHPGLGRFMSEDPKLFDAGDYNLFRYCHNDPIDMTDPMGTETNMVGRLENPGAMFALWEMTKWFDRSNNLQISFGQFTASQGLSMGQGSPAFTANYPKGDRSTASRAYKMFAATKRGRELTANGEGAIIAPIDTKHPFTTGDPKTRSIYLNPKDPLFLDRISRATFAKYPDELPPASDPGRAVIIAHEFGHLAGSHDENHRFGNNVFRNENPVRKELGLPSRPTYAGYPVPWHEEF